jgi:galactokinase/mevalonate kinase-like predicted kinase
LALQSNSRLQTQAHAQIQSRSLLCPGWAKTNRRSGPLQNAKINISINLRKAISYFPKPDNVISLVADSISEQHDHRKLTEGKSRFPMLCAILNYFGITGGTFRINSQVPYGSGLGGSGMLVVSLIALIRRLRFGVISEHDYASLCLTAHFLENWLGFSSTGFQDQLAALHGGANLWTWGAELDSSEPAFYRRTPILPGNGAAELDKHLLLCFTGQRHRPSRMWEQVRTLKGRELKRWMEVSQYTENFAMALSNSDWKGAARAAKCRVRRSCGT